ncbi:hypothetical protein BDW62DRAFT_197063 [Aspergillus aurantiobrunneus]
MDSIPDDSTPAAPPPPGVESNFIDPPSRQLAIIIMSTIFVFLMLLSVAARVYSRTQIIKLWRWDDTTCILAAISSLASTASCMKRKPAYHHETQPTLPISPGSRHRSAHVGHSSDDIHDARFLSASTAYPWAVAFAKISILLLYHRLFKSPKSTSASSSPACAPPLCSSRLRELKVASSVSHLLRSLFGGSTRQSSSVLPLQQPQSVIRAVGPGVSGGRGGHWFKHSAVGHVREVDASIGTGSGGSMGSRWTGDD